MKIISRECNKYGTQHLLKYINNLNSTNSLDMTQKRDKSKMEYKVDIHKKIEACYMEIEQLELCLKFAKQRIDKEIINLSIQCNDITL